MPAAPHPDEYFLDPGEVRRGFDAAAATFDSAAAVHGEVRARLLERLDVVRISPQLVVDLGAATGQGSRALKDRYPNASVLALDASVGMLREARRHQRLFRRFQRVAGNAARLPLRTGVVDMVFSNLMLHWCNEPDAVFAEARRVLRPEGLFTFATLGPDSLRELRVAWGGIDDHVHVHRFIDMHDLGDALMRAGFAEPVMDTERLTVTYRSVDALFAELARTGSANRARGRRHGLLGRQLARRWRLALDEQKQKEVWSLTLEVVYGHAWSAATAARSRAGHESVVPLRDIGRR